jgi:hypothetical protein
MAEGMLLFAIGVVYAVGWILWQFFRLLWQLLLWITEPIRDEIAIEKLRREEMKKREQIQAAHRAAMVNIDYVAALSLHECRAAANRLDSEPGRRQSG